MNERRWLLIETSGRIGRVGLGFGDSLVAERSLDESRRHNRDLAPAVAEILRERNWTAKSLDGVAVSTGPGSYTGLRVGIMTAKTLVYATGCELAAVPTFEIIAEQFAGLHLRLDVLADALKGKLYVQQFARAREGDAWRPATELAIIARATWLAQRARDIAVTGPGVDAVAGEIPADTTVVAPDRRGPGLGALLTLAVARPSGDPREAALKLEPVYLRPSSAEELWSAR